MARRVYWKGLVRTPAMDVDPRSWRRCLASRRSSSTGARGATTACIASASAERGLGADAGRTRQPPSGKDISGRGVRSWHTTSSSGCGAQHSIDVRDDGAGTGMTVDSVGSCLYNPCGAMVELAGCRGSHGPSIQRDAGRTSVPKINGVRALGRYPTGVLVVAGAHRQAQTPFLSKQTCEGA